MDIPSYNAEIERDPEERWVWRIVSLSPLESLWALHGYTLGEMAKRVGRALLDDRVPGRAAELGFYFFFALFPALFCAAALLGLAARSAPHIYVELLGYLSLVVPASALTTVLRTFHQITIHASSGKITFGLLGAIWSASVGTSAIQDTLNDVYKIPDTRSYLGARIKAIGLTFLLSAIVTLALACMFGSDFAARFCADHSSNRLAESFAAVGIRILAWAVAAALILLDFAAVYYWAPDWRRRRWRWLTPGGAIGIAGWILVSLGLRVYLHYFNTYSITYGSLGAVIILLTWFYLTGLMVLVGGEINSEIEAAGIERQLEASRTKQEAQQLQANPAA